MDMSKLRAPVVFLTMVVGHVGIVAMELLSPSPKVDNTLASLGSCYLRLAYG